MLSRPPRLRPAAVPRAQGRVAWTIDWREPLVAVALLLALATGAWALTRPPGPVSMPAPAHARVLERPLHLYLAIDSSGSMISRNDTGNGRLKDVEELLRWSRRWVARPGDRVAVAEFGETLVPRIDRPLAAPGPSGLTGSAPDGPETFFGPVADWVGDGARPAAANVAVLVTDAEVPDAPAALARIKRVARRVIVVQIAHGGGGRIRAAGVRVIHATTERPQAVAAAVARELLDVTGQGVR